MVDGLRIFLSYARADEHLVVPLYQRLKDEGFSPWLDRYDLPLGLEWLPEIKRAIRASDVFLACLSANSTNRRGVLQRELRQALDVLEEKLDTDIYLIPVRLEDVDAPEELENRQWVDLFQPDGMNRLLEGLSERRRQLGGPADDELSVYQPAASVTEQTNLLQTAQITADLKEAIVAGDDDEVGRLCDALIETLANSDAELPARDATMALRHLRQREYVDLTRRLAESVLQSGQRSAQVRWLYAQCLLDQQSHWAARNELKALLASATTPTEQAAVKDLIGLGKTMQYTSATNTESARVRRALREALQAYYEVYISDPQRFVRHGARAVALLARAKADGVPVSGAYPGHVELADRILGHIIDREELVGDVSAEDCASAIELAIGLDEPEQALQWAVAFTAAVGNRPHEVNSAVFQVRNVWRVDSRYSAVIEALEGGTGRADDDDATVARSTVRPDTSPSALEAVFDTESRSVEWLRTALERARSIGLVSVKGGKGIGTCFAIRGGDLHEALGDEPVVLTPNHVIGTSERQYSARPDEATIGFAALGAAHVDVGEIIWESPVGELDTTVLRLTEPVEGLVGLPIATDPPSRDRGHSVYVVGHPLAGSLSFSLERNVLLDFELPAGPKVHYRAATEPGSGGSPVFNEDWRVVAMHQASGLRIPRLNDRSGTYAAEQGVWIPAIRERLASELSANSVRGVLAGHSEVG